MAEARLLELGEIHLDLGSHKAFSDGYCAMELVSYLANEPFSDHPGCTCPVLAAFVMSWNDSLPDDERDALLLPIIPQLIGTRNPDVEEKRSLMAADWLVRTHTPAWLRLAGLAEQADALSNLPEITAMAQIPSIKGPIEAARRDAAAAGDAAWAAAGDAARDAAWDAARHAARHAARDAAGDAAGDAARHAARDAAWHAAWHAAEDAAWDVARHAARDALEPTRKELQQSALQLLKRMIAA